MKETLGDRMKEDYENRYRYYFPNHIPIIIRIDGKAFHSYTRGLKCPFDDIFMATMQKTALKLVASISGCKMAYIQSDEISLLIINDNIKSMPWFNNNISKIISVSAAMATMYFNNIFEDETNLYLKSTLDKDEKYQNILLNKKGQAIFDSRAFLLPYDEINNYFYWRQLDAIRNSILSCSQYYLGKKQSMNFKLNELQEKLITEANFDWNDLSTDKKRGACVIFQPTIITNKETGNSVYRLKPIIDKDIPNFNQDISYIAKIIYNH